MDLLRPLCYWSEVQNPKPLCLKNGAITVYFFQATVSSVSPETTRWLTPWVGMVSRASYIYCVSSLRITSSVYNSKSSSTTLLCSNIAPFDDVIIPVVGALEYLVSSFTSLCTSCNKSHLFHLYRNTLSFHLLWLGKRTIIECHNHRHSYYLSYIFILALCTNWITGKYHQ